MSKLLSKFYIVICFLQSTYITFIFLFFMLSNCAQQLAPTGGKKDITPPKLIKSTPTNKQTNYKSQTVELLFDEYVVTENLQQKLLITPDAGEYDVKTLPTGLRLKFKKTLDSAKTYSLSFGDAVKDFSEKNPAQNLRLVFSTGSYIDSASIAGQVKDIKTNEPMFDVLVGLYPHSDTLNIEKMKPLYINRTDSSGKFSLENVQPKTYRLVAIDDRNRSLTYQQKSEKMAYLSDSLVMSPSTQISDVSMRLFYANYSPQKVKSSVPRQFYYTIVYEKGIEDFKVNFASKTDTLAYFKPSANEIRFFNLKSLKDTITTKIWTRDSLGMVFEHEQKIKFREATRTNAKNTENNREPFEVTITPNESSEIEPKQLKISLEFSKPVGKFDIASLNIASDSIRKVEIKESNLQWSNNRSKLIITGQHTAKEEVRVEWPKGAFMSIENDSLASKKLKIKLMNDEDYGVLQGEITGKAPYFMIELLNDKKEVVKTIRNQNKYEFSFLKPDSYTVRVVVDTNNDGRWNTGSFSKKIQPERILFYNDVIKIKKNFVVTGIDIDLDRKP